MNQVGIGYQCEDCGDYFQRNQIKDVNGAYFCREGMGHNRPQQTITPEVIRELAQRVAEGASRAGKEWRQFVALAKASGYEGRHGGWVWFTRLDSQHPTCQGWQALAQRVVEGRTILRPEATVTPETPAAASKPAKISDPMRHALEETFQAELGISRSDKTVARSGIVEAWMIKTSTACGLIDRDMLTIQGMAYGPKDAQGYPTRWQKVHQITAVGCAAIGRDMAEIVAWAWDMAQIEYAARELTPTFPQGTREREQFEHSLGVALTEASPRCGHVAAPRTAAGTCAECEQPTCDHGAPVAGETPSAFEGAAPVRTCGDGCQSYGPYAELTEQPRHPEGTPEYAAYEAELKTELDKFAKGKEPYGYGPIEPKSLMALVNDAIAAAVRSEQVNTLGSAHFGSVRERSDARAAATAALEAVQARLDRLHDTDDPDQHAMRVLDGRA